MSFAVAPASRPKLYAQLYEAAEVGRASYVADLLCAAGIATLGLVLDSPAVVIGAMLVSPLMGPILAAGLAFAASDVYLGIKAMLGLAASIGASVLFSAALVWLLPFQAPTAELLARTQPNLLDLAVALFSGLAGSFVTARSANGGPASALPGVAIAVALMPPLCTVGFGIGSGWNLAIMSGAALLFLTNLVAIAGSAFFVFSLAGMNRPEVRAGVTEAALRQAAGNRLYTLLHDSVIGRVLGDVGHLRWRVAMVAVTLGVLFVPLRSSLVHLKDETLSRTAAREAVRRLVPPEHLLSQQLELLGDRVTLQLITTAPVPASAITAAQAEISRRSGKETVIKVRQVANEEELRSLSESLRSAAAAPPPAPPPPGLNDLRGTVLPLVEPALRGVWPAASATLADYEVGFRESGVVVRLSYLARRALDAPAQEAIRNGLRQSLGMPGLETVFDWRGAAPVKR